MNIKSMNARDCVHALIECSQQIRELEARLIHLLAHLAIVYEEPDYAAVEAGLALQVSSTTMSCLMADAVAMVARLPRTLAMLAAGEIDSRRAKAILEVTAACTDAITAEVEEKVLAKAASRTAAQVRRATRDAVNKADPAGFAERHRTRVKDRAVKIYDTDDGMSTMSIDTSAPIAQAMYTKVDLLASQIHDSTRSKDQIRADVLADLVLTGPRDSGPRPLIQITMPLATLVGCNDDPCELNGYGQIPAEVARDLAVDPGSVWHRLLTDPAGEQLLDYGTRTYRPPAGLDRFVRARDKTCVHPGCRRPARRCHLDHTIPYPDGPTSAGNLKPRCERHHLFKHLPGVVVVQNDDGATTLKTPLGLTYREDTA